MSLWKARQKGGLWWCAHTEDRPHAEALWYQLLDTSCCFQGRLTLAMVSLEVMRHEAQETFFRTKCSSWAWDKPLLSYFLRISSPLPTGTRRRLQYLEENTSLLLPTNPCRKASTCQVERCQAIVRQWHALLILKCLDVYLSCQKAIFSPLHLNAI